MFGHEPIYVVPYHGFCLYYRAYPAFDNYVTDNHESTRCELKTAPTVQLLQSKESKEMRMAALSIKHVKSSRVLMDIIGEFKRGFNKAEDYGHGEGGKITCMRLLERLEEKMAFYMAETTRSSKLVENARLALENKMRQNQHSDQRSDHSLAQSEIYVRKCHLAQAIKANEQLLGPLRDCKKCIDYVKFCIIHDANTLDDAVADLVSCYQSNSFITLLQNKITS